MCSGEPQLDLWDYFGVISGVNAFNKGVRLRKMGRRLRLDAKSFPTHVCKSVWENHHQDHVYDLMQSFLQEVRESRPLRSRRRRSRPRKTKKRSSPEDSRNVMESSADDDDGPEMQDVKLPDVANGVTGSGVAPHSTGTGAEGGDASADVARGQENTRKTAQNLLDVFPWSSVHLDRDGSETEATWEFRMNQLFRRTQLKDDAEYGDPWLSVEQLLLFSRQLGTDVDRGALLYNDGEGLGDAAKFGQTTSRFISEQKTQGLKLRHCHTLLNLLCLCPSTQLSDEAIVEVLRTWLGRRGASEQAEGGPSFLSETDLLQLATRYASRSRYRYDPQGHHCDAFGSVFTLCSMTRPAVFNFLLDNLDIEKLWTRSICREEQCERNFSNLDPPMHALCDTEGKKEVGFNYSRTLVDQHRRKVSTRSMLDKFSEAGGAEGVVSFTRLLSKVGEHNDVVETAFAAGDPIQKTWIDVRQALAWDGGRRLFNGGIMRADHLPIAPERLWQAAATERLSRSHFRRKNRDKRFGVMVVWLTNRVLEWTMTGIDADNMDVVTTVLDFLGPLEFTRCLLDPVAAEHSNVYDDNYHLTLSNSDGEERPIPLIYCDPFHGPSVEKFAASLLRSSGLDDIDRDSGLDDIDRDRDSTFLDLFHGEDALDPLYFRPGGDDEDEDEYSAVRDRSEGEGGVVAPPSGARPGPDTNLFSLDLCKFACRCAARADQTSYPPPSDRRECHLLAAADSTCVLCVARARPLERVITPAHETGAGSGVKTDSTTPAAKWTLNLFRMFPPYAAAILRERLPKAQQEMLERVPAEREGFVFPHTDKAPSRGPWISNILSESVRVSDLDLSMGALCRTAQGAGGLEKLLWFLRENLMEASDLRRLAPVFCCGCVGENGVVLQRIIDAAGALVAALDSAVKRTIKIFQLFVTENFEVSPACGGGKKNPRRATTTTSRSRMRSSMI